MYLIQLRNLRRKSPTELTVKHLKFSKQTLFHFFIYLTNVHLSTLYSCSDLHQHRNLWLCSSSPSSTTSHHHLPSQRHSEFVITLTGAQNKIVWILSQIYGSSCHADLLPNWWLSDIRCCSLTSMFPVSLCKYSQCVYRVPSFFKCSAWVQGSCIILELPEAHVLGPLHRNT